MGKRRTRSAATRSPAGDRSVSVPDEPNSQTGASGRGGRRSRSRRLRRARSQETRRLPACARFQAYVLSGRRVTAPGSCLLCLTGFAPKTSERRWIEKESPCAPGIIALSRSCDALGLRAPYDRHSRSTTRLKMSRRSWLRFDASRSVRTRLGFSPPHSLFSLEGSRLRFATTRSNPVDAAARLLNVVHQPSIIC